MYSVYTAVIKDISIMHSKNKDSSCYMPESVLTIFEIPFLGINATSRGDAGEGIPTDPKNGTRLSRPFLARWLHGLNWKLKWMLQLPFLHFT